MNDDYDDDDDDFDDDFDDDVDEDFDDDDDDDNYVDPPDPYDYDYIPVVGNAHMKFHEDDEVEVVGNQTGLNQIGNRFTVRGPMPGNPAYINVKENNWHFLIQDLKLLPLGKDKMEKRANEAKVKFEKLQDKLSYMDESGVEKFDEEEFKKFQVKKIIGNLNLTTDARAERIHNLFSGND